MMISGIEISPSGRAECVICGKKIAKETPRGIITMSNPMYGIVRRFVCWRCVRKIMENHIKEQKELLKRFNKLKEEQQDQILLDNLIMEDGK